MLRRMNWRVFRLALAPSLVVVVGCFSEPPSTNGSSSGTTGSTPTTSDTAEVTGSTADEDDESSSDGGGSSSSGEGSSSTGAERPDVVHLYFTDNLYTGDFEEASIPLGEGIAAWADTQCAESTAYLANDCDIPFALVDLPQFPLISSIPDGPFVADGMPIAETGSELFLGQLVMTLEDAGVVPGEGNHFWTGVGPMDCMGWGVSANADGTVGDAAMDGQDWLTSTQLACDTRLPLLCACWTE